MSRLQFTTDDGLRFVVGFDRPLGSFFAQLVQGKAKDEMRDRELEGFRGMGFGANAGEGSIGVDDIIDALEEVGVTVPEDTFWALLDDGP